MYMKFPTLSTGSPPAAAAYFLAKRDAAGREPAAIEVPAGVPKERETTETGRPESL